MFEATEHAWTLPTSRGAAQTWHEIKADGTLAAVFETGKVTVSGCCAGCNIPGGGGHTDIAKPPDNHWSNGQDACQQTDREKCRCPLMRDTVRDVLHFGEVCSTLHCPACEKLGAAGRMRINDLVTVHASRVVTVGVQGQAVHTKQGYCFVGRYLGMDMAGHSMRFELMEPGKGPSGLRCWLTNDGTFIEDLNPDVREQLEQGARPVTGGIHTAASMREAEAAGQKKPGRNEPCPCGSGKKYKACHGGN